MNTTSVDLEHPEEPTLESGPGRRLLEARAAAELTLDDVAAQLHLDKTTIEALEQDDYAHLPAPAFVRGYLRSYARLLDLAPGPVVNAYDSRGFAPPALVADISTNTHAQGESTDLPWRLMTYLVVAVVVVLVVLWWRNNMSDPFSVLVGTEPPVATIPLPAGNDSGDTSLAFENRTRPENDEPAVTEAPPIPGPTTDEAAPVVTVTGTQPSAAAAASAAASDPVSLPIAPAPESDVSEAPAEPPSGGAITAATPEATAEGEGEPAGDAETAVSGSAPLAETAEATPAASQTASLSLDFTHDSWVEVYDAAGERMFFGMARAGRSLQLEGEAPVRVLLGYARDIRVEYNGAPLDFSPYVNRGIARFTLGADGIRGETEATAPSAQ